MYIHCQTKKEFNSIKNQNVNIIHYNNKLYIKDENANIKSSDTYKVNGEISFNLFKGAKQVDIDELTGKRTKKAKLMNNVFMNDLEASSIYTQTINGIDFNKLLQRVEALEVGHNSIDEDSSNKDDLTGLAKRVSALENKQTNHNLNQVESDLENMMIDLERQIDERLKTIEGRISSTYESDNSFDLLALINAQALKIAYLEKQVGWLTG